MTQLPPQNIEMEEAVLGSMLVDSKARAACMKNLAADDFYRDSNRAVFEAIVSLEGDGKPVDELATIEEMKRLGTANLVGGSVALMMLTQRAPSWANHKAYSAAVRLSALRRSLVEAGTGVAQAGYETDDPEALVEQVEATALNARLRVAQVRGVGDGTWLADMSEAWDYLAGPDEDVVPFPLQKLTRIGGGQRRGHVVVTGGYSADGKSWFGLECAEVAALAGARTLIDSLEMPTDEVFARLVAMGGGMEYGEVLAKTAPVERVAQRMSVLQKLPIKVVDASHEVNTVTRLRLELTKARVDRKPFRYVLVDHLHLLAVRNPQNYRIELNVMLAQFKRLAAEFKVTIHLLAQLKRASGDNAYPIPTMASFRESSAIENIADYALMVYRNRDGAALRADGFVVPVKVRSGVNCGAVPVAFSPTTYRFKFSPPAVPGVVGAVA